LTPGPHSADRGELHHRAERHHRCGGGGGGRREDKALHGDEGGAGPISLLAGELHRWVELLCGPVGEYRTETIGNYIIASYRKFKNIF